MTRLGVSEEPLVNLREIAEIELFIIKRMKDFTLGDHASVFKGSGFNFVGVRDWEPAVALYARAVRHGGKEPELEHLPEVQEAV